MHTLIQPLAPPRRGRSAKSVRAAIYRQPHYDCTDSDTLLTLNVFVPGVTPAGIEIRTQGPDLVVIARKAHLVRANWTALHLEHAQRDYRLRLRLGRGLDYPAMEGTLHEGVLTLRLPKRSAPVGAKQLPP